MMEDDMNLGLVLGKKYRVAQGDCTVVGIPTHVELDTHHRISGVTTFTDSCLELTTGPGRWGGDPYTAGVYVPWDLIEPVTGRGW